jgi:hypothetical protein
VRKLPWLFHIPDPELAAQLAPYLSEVDALIIADPAHLRDDERRHYVHTVTGPILDPEGYEVLSVLIHAVDWTREVEWLPDELANVAADLYTWADSPATFIPDMEDIPADAPPGVAEWLGIDEGY